VTIDTDEIRRHYELLTDQALLATNRDDLVPAAQAIYDEEVDKRGLNKPAEPAPEGAPEPEAGEPQEVAEGLVSVGSFTVVDEARFARGLLQGGQIPCGLVNDKADPMVLLLMVPESHVDAALEILAGEISDEELAAQAEAAGFEEEAFKEEAEEE
jgi:hypothetical protein